MFDKDLGMTLSVFSSALLFADKYKMTTYIKSTLLLHISDNLIPSIIIDYHEGQGNISFIAWGMMS
jgi:hypothetical protein